MWSTHKGRDNTSLRSTCDNCAYGILAKVSGLITWITLIRIATTLNNTRIA